MTGSWKTTTLGILAILGAVISIIKSLLDGDPTTNPDWSATSAAIAAGWGLMNARDDKVTSEQAGAK